MRFTAQSNQAAYALEKFSEHQVGNIGISAAMPVTGDTREFNRVLKLPVVDCVEWV